MRALVGMAFIALVAGIACGSASGTRVQGGLYGKVTKGPLQPVCREGVPCTGPAAGVTLVFRRNGTVAARTTTRKNGSYRVALKPGRYTVRVRPSAVHRPKPYTVSVPRRAFRHIDFFVDTGIR